MAIFFIHLVDSPVSAPAADANALIAEPLSNVLDVRAMPVMPPAPAPAPRVMMDVPAVMENSLAQSNISKSPLTVDTTALALEETPVDTTVIPTGGPRVAASDDPTPGAAAPAVRMMRATPPTASSALPAAATAPCSSL